jgi:hypothetical protein
VVTSVRVPGSPVAENILPEEDPSGSDHDHKSSDTPKPSAGSWIRQRRRILRAAATGSELAAEALDATGHDGLAIAARTVASLLDLYLVATDLDERDHDQG